MRLLLDTHVFLWYITADRRLSKAQQAAIQDAENEVFLSGASVWEAVIKNRLGKLPLPSSPAEYLSQQRQAHEVASLAIDEEAMSCLAELPPLHRDPFDRLLVAQAIQHGLQIATLDPAIREYNVPVL